MGAEMKMPKKLERFPTVLPVIHATSTRQVLSNARIAVEAGAGGVFLINHEGGHQELLKFHAELTERFPELWVGLNSLGRSPTWVAHHPAIAGIWSDNAYVLENQDEQTFAAPIVTCIRENGWSGYYFGGVAFKGQRKVRPEHLGLAAKKAMAFVDVVTTSGSGTGEAAAVDKVRVMKEALGTFPLALASGVTPDNVSDYLPYVDCFLVATGISDDFEHFNPTLTRRLVDRVRTYTGG